MTAYERSDVKRGLAVKRGTDDVPSDGRFHVLMDGEVVLSTHVEAAALAEYEDLRSQRMKAGRQTLEAEAALRDAQRFRNDVLTDKATRRLKQGGKGKGGVGG